MGVCKLIMSEVTPFAPGRAQSDVIPVISCPAIVFPNSLPEFVILLHNISSEKVTLILDRSQSRTLTFVIVGGVFKDKTAVPKKSIE